MFMWLLGVQCEALDLETKASTSGSQGHEALVADAKPLIKPRSGR